MVKKKAKARKHPRRVTGNTRYVSVSAAFYERLAKAGKDYDFLPSECVDEVLNKSLPVDLTHATNDIGK